MTPPRNEDHCCANCERIWKLTELKEIADFWARVEPGETVPSGECPDCGALCYPY